MEQRKYDKCVEVLKKELVPALGCTEPIAIAFAAARASQILGCQPERLEAVCSGNIIKNVMGVIVPNSGQHKGVDVAATLGAVAGNADANLNVLEGVTEEDIEKCMELVEAGFCQCKLAEGVDNLYILIKAYSGEQSA